MMTCIDPSFGRPGIATGVLAALPDLRQAEPPPPAGKRGTPILIGAGPIFVLRCFPIRKTAACILTQRFSQCNPPSPGIRHGIPELKAVAVTKQSPIVYPDACNGALKQASFSL